MKKGKIALSICTSLLCIGMLAGCNDGTVTEELKHEVGDFTTWEEVLEFLDSIYINTSSWEAVSCEYNTNNLYENTASIRVTDDNGNFVTWEYIPYTQTTIRNGVMEFTSDNDGKTFGYSEYDYSYEVVSPDMLESNYSSYNYREVSNILTYIGDQTRYEKDYYNKVTHEYGGGVVDSDEYPTTTYTTSSSKYAFSYIMSSDFAYYITTRINNYGTNADKNYVLWANIDGNSIEWEYVSPGSYYYRYRIYLEVDERGVIDYFSYIETRENDSYMYRTEVVIKEIEKESVVTPDWFDPYEYEEL